MANTDGLERMNKVLEQLGHPEEELRVFHIAGTNGKGSTACMIASILAQAGYRVGMYTSPHLEDVLERIQLITADGSECIAQERYDELGAAVDEAAVACGYESVHYFERLTAIAYLYYHEMKPDYVVLESGLGGRLDTTNTIAKPLVSVITQVGLDHTQVLGNTIFRIAREKAGIIKPGVPVVSQTSDTMVRNVLVSVARDNGCDFYDASVETDKIRKYSLQMKGDHQLANAATAIEAIEAAGIQVTEDNISVGLAKSFYPGRFEIIEASGNKADRKVIWLLDGAHNPDAMDALISTYNAWAGSNKTRRALVVFGCMKDKNYGRMIQLMTQKLRGCNYATAAVDDARAEDPMVLGQQIAERGHSCEVCDSVAEAVKYAEEGNFQAILVTGSLYLVGAVRQYLKEKETE